jgi:hypothetical protein
MLTIRAEQTAALYDDLFERWMDGHLRRFFPSLCADRSAENLRDFVRAGIVKARRYGFVEPAGISGFVDLLLVLGETFDIDPALPWAAGVLSDVAPGTAAARLGSLRHFAHEFLSTGAVTTSVFALPEPELPAPADSLDRDGEELAAEEPDA